MAEFDERTVYHQGRRFELGACVVMANLLTKGGLVVVGLYADSWL